MSLLNTGYGPEAPKPTNKQPLISEDRNGSYKPSSVEKINKKLRTEERKKGERSDKAKERQETAQAVYEERSRKAGKPAVDSTLKSWKYAVLDDQVENAEARMRKADANVADIKNDLEDLAFVTDKFYHQSKDVLHEQAYRQAEREGEDIVGSPYQQETSPELSNKSE